MPTEATRVVRVPGDKSITHRALLLAALADGECRIRQPLDAADTRSTVSVLTALGARIEPAGGAELRVRGRGLRGLVTPGRPLDCGNSGTTARLLLGVLAAQPVLATVDGDDSLRGRPMRRVTGPLRELGAAIRELGAPDRLPVEVRGGALRPGTHRSPTASAQVKSAVLLAGLCGGVPVAVTEPMRSRDHTERMLRGLGVPVREEAAESGHTVSLEPVQGLSAFALTVPGDVSAAAFLLAAALLLRVPLRIAGVGVNPTRTGLLGVLARMGAAVELRESREEGGEPIADLVVQPGPLVGASVGGAEVPALIDEVPVLACLAARAEGETVITGAAELRVKESDRIAGVVANLQAVGVTAEELSDGLAVRGTQAPLQGRVLTAGDHRVAMAFGVLAAQPGNRIHIDQPGAAAVSFPGIWQLLGELGGAP